jgi:Tetratricopeptide repeat
MTLNNLANLYSDTQRLEESEQCLQEALQLYRALSERNPIVYQSRVTAIVAALAALAQKPH